MSHGSASSEDGLVVRSMFWSWARTASPFSSVNQIFSPRLLRKYRASVALLWYIAEYIPIPQKRCSVRYFFDIHLTPGKVALGLSETSASPSSSELLASSDSSDSSSLSSASDPPTFSAPTGGLTATPAVETGPSGASASESLTSGREPCWGRSWEAWFCSRLPFPFRFRVMIGDRAGPLLLFSSSSFRRYTHPSRLGVACCSLASSDLLRFASRRISILRCRCRQYGVLDSEPFLDDILDSGQLNRGLDTNVRVGLPLLRVGLNRRPEIGKAVHSVDCSGECECVGS